MEYRNKVRAGYFAKAVMWAIVALVFASPAIKYLAEYGRYVQGGINGFFK